MSRCADCLFQAFLGAILCVFVLAEVAFCLTVGFVIGYEIYKFIWAVSKTISEFTQAIGLKNKRTPQQGGNMCSSPFSI